MKSHPNIKDDALFALFLEEIKEHQLLANFDVLLDNCTSDKRLTALMSKLEKFEVNPDLQAKVITSRYFSHLESTKKLEFVMRAPDSSHFEVLSDTLGSLSYEELKDASSLLPQYDQWKQLFEKADNLNKAKHVDAGKDILCILFKMHSQQKCNKLDDETFKSFMA